jgi:hypothetical protein
LTSSGSSIERRTSTTAFSAIVPSASSSETKKIFLPSAFRPTPSIPGIIGNVPVLV